MATPSQELAALDLMKNTKMTLKELQDFEDCTPDEAAALMKGYEDQGMVPNRGFWVKLANGLQALEAYAPIAGLLISAIPLL
jgi:hypothetical protein